MGDTRLKIVNRRKRRSVFNFFIIVVMLLLLVCALLIIKHVLGNKSSSEDTNDTTTTTITEEQTTIVTTVISDETNNYVKDFVYNFSLSNDKYKLYVCNKESYARISTYKIYDKNNYIGESTTTKGLSIDKSAIDLSKMKNITIEVDNKKYSLKYDDNCK